MARPCGRMSPKEADQDPHMIGPLAVTTYRSLILLRAATLSSSSRSVQDRLPFCNMHKSEEPYNIQLQKCTHVIYSLAGCIEDSSMHTYIHTHNCKLDWKLSRRGFETAFLGRVWAASIVVNCVGLQWANDHIMNFTGLVQDIMIWRCCSISRIVINTRRRAVFYRCWRWIFCNPW